MTKASLLRLAAIVGLAGFAVITTSLSSSRPAPEAWVTAEFFDCSVWGQPIEVAVFPVTSGRSFVLHSKQQIFGKRRSFAFALPDGNYRITAGHAGCVSDAPLTVTSGYARHLTIVGSSTVHIRGPLGSISGELPWPFVEVGANCRRKDGSTSTYTAILDSGVFYIEDITIPAICQLTMTLGSPRETHNVGQDISLSVEAGGFKIRNLNWTDIEQALNTT